MIKCVSIYKNTFNACSIRSLGLSLRVRWLCIMVLICDYYCIFVRYIRG